MKIELQNVLRRELKARHMTITALARKCGISASVLHAWVQGVLPSAKNLHHVASLSRCLDIPVSVLLFNQDDRSSQSLVLFNSEFDAGDERFRVSIEKMPKEDK